MTDTIIHPGTDLGAARDFVEKSCAAAVPKVAYTAADLKWATTRLVHHVLLTEGVLTRKVVFHPRTIDTFITTALPKMTAASRSNVRSILLRMTEVLLGERAPRVRLTPISAADPSVPYTVDEIGAFRVWAARAQSDRRGDAAALVALGFGAGLSGGEVADLRIGDVAVDGSAVTIEVSGPRQRTVRVDNAWTRLLVKAVTGRDGEEFVFCPKREGVSKNLVNNFVARTSGSIPGPNSQRMRATWIVAQLDSAMTPAVLLEQAGVRNLAALGRYLPFAKAA